MKKIHSHIKISCSKTETQGIKIVWIYQCGNDPSAGSPTETLLRLHLPLNGKV